MSDLQMLHRAMILDPWDDVARLAYCDEFEMMHGVRPHLLTEWRDTLELFLRDARSLFSYFPIREVALMDREPAFTTTGEYVLVYRGSEDRSEYPHVLPGVFLPERMEGYFLVSSHFKKREQALAAISSQAVNYGRALVGLPPLLQPVGVQ